MLPLLTQDLNVDPMVTQFYTSISVFLTSFIVLTYNDFAFTYFGIIAAALWVPANLFAVLWHYVS
jgi:hypothetical protein